MTTPNITSSTDSQMHNNIMAGGSRDCPPMLAPGRYPQWHSRFLQHVDTRPNSEALRKCILSDPYKPTTILVQVVEATDDSPAVPEHTTEIWEAIERSQAPSPKPSIPSRSHTTTRHKGKEIAKPITPPSEIASEEDNDPEQAQREKDMQKNLALIAKYFKKIYKPTNNNLKTSSNSKNKNVDTTPRLGFSALTARNMDILPRNAETQKGLRTPHKEVDEQELEAHYSYMAKIEESDSLKFVHELKQEMHADLKYVESLEKEIDELESDKAKFLDMYDEIFKLKKLTEEGKGKFIDTKFNIPSVVRQPNAQRILKPSVLGKPTPFLNSLDRIYFQNTKSVPKANVSEGLSKPITTQTLPKAAKKAVSNTNVLRPGMYRIDNRTAHIGAPQLPRTVKNTNPRVSTSTGVNHKPTVSSHNLRAINREIRKMLNDVHARTKKPTVVPISTRKPKSQANKLIATPNKKKFAPILGYGILVQGNDTINRVYYVEGLNHNLFLVGQFFDADLEVAFRKSTCFVRDLQGNDLLTDKLKEKGDQCILVGYSTQSKGYHVYNKRTRMIVESIHIRFDEIKEVAKTFVANNNADIPSQQELDLLFGLLYDVFFNAGSNPSTNVQSTSAPSTHTNVHA
nr:integrase, catalytic region, zinc finger, CCHC-type, peptidase aspartic, catalytic [Tanacetum cinerariifolium]